jgi:hypothetical protein
VECPQQNGIVERKHQHILNIGRAFLYRAKLSKPFWAYAFKYSVHIINRLPSPILQNKSPYELVFQSRHDLNELKVFGF